MTKPYPYTPEQEAWLRDLETTEEPQAKGALHRVIPDRNSPAGYCCLGRACVVLAIEEITEEGLLYSSFGEQAVNAWLPQVAIRKLWLRGSGGELAETFYKGKWAFSQLADMNDAGWSFKRIAAYIRENPWNVFIAPEPLPPPPSEQEG
jgi:hypothetical protein